MSSGKKGRKCSMIHCNSFQHTHKHLSFFRFPKDPERCKAWIEHSGRPELADKMAVYEDRICELHFDDSMFLNDYRNRLHQTAVPSRHLNADTAKARAMQKGLAEPPAKRSKQLPSNDLIDIIKSLTPEQQKLLVHHQHTAAVAAAAAAAAAAAVASATEAANNSATTQQAYVIAAQAVQGNGMSCSKAAEKFGVDYATLRRFCRRLEKTMTPNQAAVQALRVANTSPSLTITPSGGQTKCHPKPSFHKKQQHMALIEEQILAQQRMLLQKHVAESFQQQEVNATPPRAQSVQTAAKKVPTPTPASQPPTTDTPSPMTKRPRQIFSVEQEDELANFVRDTSNYYNGMSSKDVRTLAFVYAVCNRVEMPPGWKEASQASFDWCLGFIKRNKLSPMMTTSHMYKVPTSAKLASTAPTNGHVSSEAGKHGVSEITATGDD